MPKRLQETGLIWADLDMFLLKPLQPDNGYLCARGNKELIYNGILSFPENSPTLADLIEFCEDYYSIPLLEHRKRVIIKESLINQFLLYNFCTSY